MAVAVEDAVGEAVPLAFFEHCSCGVKSTSLGLTNGRPDVHDSVCSRGGDVRECWRVL